MMTACEMKDGKRIGWAFCFWGNCDMLTAMDDSVAVMCEVL